MGLSRRHTCVLNQIEAAVLPDFLRLLEYHEKVATDSQIQAHYANVELDDIRWMYLPRGI